MPRERNPPIPSARPKKRKRANTVSSATDRKIAKIAQTVVLRSIETKHLLYDNDSQSTGTSPVSYNVMYLGASRGTTETNFLGEKFYLKGISARVFGNNNTGVALTTPSNPNKVPLTVKLMILAAKDFNTVTSLSATQFCDQGFTNYPLCFYVDPNKAKVLASAEYKINPNFLDGVNGQFDWGQAECYAPIEKQVSFRNFTSSFELSEWNYYVVHWATIGGCPIKVSFKAYIKDA